MPVALQVFLAALLSAPGQLTALWDGVATARLEARVKAMREAGEPASLADLHRLYPDPPKGQNAARLYRAAFAQMKKIAEQDPGNDLPIVGDTELPPEGEALPQAMLEAIEAYLDLHTDVLGLLHRAAKLDGCKFPLRFEDGLMLRLQHLSSMRGATRLLALEAIARTERGKADEAADSIVASLRIGHHLRHEPVLITALVRIACDSIAVAQAQRWVSRVAPSPEALGRVQKALAGEADRTLLENVFLAERCFGMDCYRRYVLNPKKRKINELVVGLGGPAPVLLNVVPKAYFKMDMVHYIDLMTAYVEAGRRPYPASLQAGARLGQDLEKQIPRHYVMCRTLLPALGRRFIAAQRHMARVDTARLALAALRHKAKHGKLPEMLDALVPDLVEALPPDPFSGKPLLYRKDAEGFVLYAVGENGRDDQGDIERANGKQPDIGFRYIRPKAQF